MNQHRLSYGNNLPLTVGGGPGTVGFDFGGIISAVNAGANLLGGLAGKEKAKAAQQPAAKKDGDGGIDLAGVGNLLGGVANIANSLFGGGGGGRPQPAPAPAAPPVPPVPAPAPLPALQPPPPPIRQAAPAPPPLAPLPQPSPMPQAPPPPAKKQRVESPRRKMAKSRIRRIVNALADGLQRSSSDTVQAVLDYMYDLQESPNMLLLEQTVSELEQLVERRERREEIIAIIRAEQTKNRGRRPRAVRGRALTTGGHALSTGVSMGANGAVQHQNGYGATFVQQTINTHNPAQGSGGYVLSSGVTGGAGCPWQYQNYMGY